MKRRGFLVWLIAGVAGLCGARKANKTTYEVVADDRMPQRGDPHPTTGATIAEPLEGALIINVGSMAYWTTNGSITYDQ